MNLPFSHRLPYQRDSALLFSKLHHLPWSAFLESGQPYGRYDILTALPYLTLTTREAGTFIQGGGKESLCNTDPLHLIKQLLMLHPTTASHLPFSGGALGYFSYDFGKKLANISAEAHKMPLTPLIEVGFYDWAIVVDHQDQETFLVSHLHQQETRGVIERILDKLTVPSVLPIDNFHLKTPFTATVEPKDYAKAFHRIQDHLQAGDCYQTNLCQKFSATFEGTPWAAFELLRRQSPAPYAAFLNFPSVSVLSFSPERFLKVADQQVETKPIKGTRRRAVENPSIDARLMNELLHSVKDRAENLMIVDLLRNDLSKSCITGSIKVPTLFGLESFPAVHHLVSTITGQLRPDEHAMDLFRNAFPGGSITGAPKLRAMQIIDALEPFSRHLYCGAIGYVGFDGHMDTNIAIRTLMTLEDKMFCYAGGAITVDSSLAEEYQECFDKIGLLLEILNKTKT